MCRLHAGGVPRLDLAYEKDVGTTRRTSCWRRSVVSGELGLALDVSTVFVGYPSSMNLSASTW